MVESPKFESNPAVEHNATRAALIDATEDIMREEGYAAVSSRRIAAKVGVKGPTIHYFFKTIDNLYIAVYRKIAEDGIRRMEAMLHTDASLQTLWAHSSAPDQVKLTADFISLAHHRPAIRAEIAYFTDKARSLQIEIVRRYFAANDISFPLPVETIPMLMSGISYLLTLDDSIGASVGHKETRALFDAVMLSLEKRSAVTVIPEALRC